MPNDPYLDASVAWRIKTGHVAFHEPGFREVAEAITESGVATEVIQRIGSGKEADVYYALDGEQPIAVKAYRLYRTTHRGGRPIKIDTMGQKASREFELLYYAWRNGAPVPEPGRRIENLVSMEYLGTPQGPAPMLRHAALEDPERFLSETVRGVEALIDAGVVHSDLSPFNILVHRRKPWIIDLAACHRVDRLGLSPWMRLTEAETAIRHGLVTLERHFRRYRIPLETESLARRWVGRLDRFGVLS